MPARLLGTAAGGMIVLTNIGTLLAGVGVSGAVLLCVHLVLAVVWIGAGRRGAVAAPGPGRSVAGDGSVRSALRVR